MVEPELFARLSLFRDASPEMLGVLARCATDVRFPVDGVLFLAGSQPRGWFVVIEGNVRVVRASGGRQHVVHTEGPGGTLGEVPLFTGEVHPATGIASEPTRCAVFDRVALEAAMRECPAIGFLMAKRLALRVKHLVERLDDRSTRSVRHRLARFLLEKGELAPGDIFPLGMTQGALAEELGTVREVLTRELKALGESRLIQSHGGGWYQIIDQSGLERAAMSQD